MDQISLFFNDNDMIKIVMTWLKFFPWALQAHLENIVGKKPQNKSYKMTVL